MKSVWSVLMLLLVNLLVQSGAVRAQQTVHMYATDYPPAIFMNDNGQADGFLIDVLRAIFREHSINVEFHITAVRRAPAEMSQSKQACIFPYPDTPENAAHGDGRTVAPLFLSDEGWFIRASQNDITSVKDLADRSVGIQVLRGVDDRMREQLGFITKTRDIVEGLRMLEYGRIDALLTNATGAEMAGRQMGVDIKLAFPSSRELYWLICNSDLPQEIVGQLNEALDQGIFRFPEIWDRFGLRKRFSDNQASFLEARKAALARRGGKDN